MCLDRRLGFQQYPEVLPLHTRPFCLPLNASVGFQETRASVQWRLVKRHLLPKLRWVFDETALKDNICIVCAVGIVIFPLPTTSVMRIVYDGVAAADGIDGFMITVLKFLFTCASC